MLTPVHADALHDQALNFLRTSKVDVGEYVDYSGAAVTLMKRADINTYSGTFEVGTVGSTKHDTVRGKGKRSLRTSMKAKFDELVSADRIVNAEIELSRDYSFNQVRGVNRSLPGSSFFREAPQSSC
jgi:hypothetical protein